MMKPKQKNIMKKEIKNSGHFHVTIFGSARIKRMDRHYKDAYKLAADIGRHGFGIVTGGGPGLMEASNAGQQAGSHGNGHSIGLPIKIFSESAPNKHLDIKKSFNNFSKRLDNFMLLSHVVVVMPGGIGTCLEFFYTWQLMQVKHICPMPIILYGTMWKKLLTWIKTNPLRKEYLSKDDLKNIYCVDNNEQAMKIIEKQYEVYKKQGGKSCSNYKIYDI